jgi:hypothetical protein
MKKKNEKGQITNSKRKMIDKREKKKRCDNLFMQTGHYEGYIYNW